MKLLHIHLGDNEIELYNSFLGKETVKVNGVTVSSKDSLTGTAHLFKLKEGDKMAKGKLVTGYGPQGIIINFYKDDQPIFVAPKTGWFRFFLAALVIIAVIVVLTLLIFEG